MAFFVRRLASAICLILAAGLLSISAGAQVPSLAWQKSIYGHGNTDAVPGGADFVLGKRSMAVDASGNVYVTGSSSNGSNADFLTIKYNAAGAIQWRAVANGSANSADVAYALALDGSGNVVVTGTSYAAGLANYLTVKYDNNGSELWRATFNGAQNGDDEAYAVAIDAGGNIYVTGTSFNGTAYDFGSVLDFLTIKYSPSGAQLWTRRVTGTDRGVDRPNAIAVDGSGNVVVAGYSYSGSSAGNDFLTVKYDTSGNELWRATFDAAGGSDLGFALAIDASGNVYLAGQGFNGTDNDYLTIKYDASGAKQWHRMANGTGNAGDIAYAVAVDASGNVIVHGQSDLASGGLPGPANPKYMTVKYDAAGTELWRATTNGSGTGYDISSALAVDAAGNIYVTGYDGSGVLLSLKYGPAGGAPAWSSSIAGAGSANGAALVSTVIDGTGNVHVAGYQGSGTGNDFLVVKYDASGAEQWRANEGQHIGISTAFASDLVGRDAMKVDAAGNIYITGRSNYGAGSDYLTAKYDLSGNELWRAMANGPGNNIDQPYALAVDSGGNVYATGDSYANSRSGMLTVKYSASGIEQWRVVASDGATESVSARVLAVDSAGDVIVSGLSFNGFDFLTVKYNANGVEQWRAKANRAADGIDTPVAMLTDAARNVYVTGRSADGINNGYLTVKYNASGQEQWRALENASIDYVAKRNYAMALDANGNLVVAGDAVVKYDGTGAFLWRVEPTFQPQQVAIDASGNIFMAGTRGMAAKYNAAGVELWSRAVSGTADANDAIRAMTIDADSNVYVSNQNYALGNTDYMTVKYNGAGAEQWRIVTPTQGGAYFSAAALAVDAARSVILASNSISTGSPTAMSLSKYRVVTPAPTITAAVAGNSRATVTFLPPASDGGVPIVSYTVSCDPGMAATGPASPIVVAGLSNGVTYQCSVTANNALGASLPSAALSVTPSATAPLVLIDVVSRKTHGSAGDFDLPLETLPAIGGAVSVEPRAIGAGHTVVYRFSDIVSSSGTASAVGAQSMPVGTISSVTVSDNSVLVTLTGIADGQRATVSLSGVNVSTSATVSLGFLVGDVNSSRSVNASDISGVKARIGQTANTSNFMFDFNTSGVINSADQSAAKARSGAVLP